MDAAVNIPGVEMFTCMQYAHPVRMPVRDCVLRQKRAQEHRNTFTSGVAMPASFEKCMDCAQGKQVLEGEKDMEESAVYVTCEAKRSSAEPDRKACRVCGERKDLAEFVQNKTCKDGTENICKACKSLKSAEYWKKRRAKKKGKKTKPAEKPVSKLVDLPVCIFPEDEFIMNRIVTLCAAIEYEVKAEKGVREELMAYAGEISRRLDELKRLQAENA